jgi:NADH dehydrogenase [ubiquinone] 1 alpha subcomplex assembly factor 5
MPYDRFENGNPHDFYVSFQIGWKPSKTTPQPKKRGSAQKSLKDVL